MSASEDKKRAAAVAADLIETGMTVGLGTGSTAAHFIDLLGARMKDGLDIVGVPTSEESAAAAMRAGVPLIEPDEGTVIDIDVDGADEVDGDLNLIKGGGGALFREKIVAQAARRFVVIADASKKVTALGAFPLPIEIDPTFWGVTMKAARDVFAANGFDRVDMQLRPRRDREGVFLTDGGRYIVDCALGRIAEPCRLDRELRAIAGVVETGLFIDLADEAILCGPNGVERLTRA